MAKWTKDEVKQLKKLYRNNSTRVVAKVLGRSRDSVESKAGDMGLKKTKKYMKALHGK